MHSLARHFESLDDSLSQSEWQIMYSFLVLSQSRECVRSSEAMIGRTRTLLDKLRFNPFPLKEED